MDPRPAEPDDPGVTLTLPGSPPGPGVSADDAAKPEQLAIGWPPRLPQQPGEALPARWYYPEQCENGHEWGPGRVLVSWKRCNCAGAQTAHPEDHSWGHTTVECGEPGCRWKCRRRRISREPRDCLPSHGYDHCRDRMRGLPD